ncbi:dioxygenase [Geodermatophilus sabuli]|uniref:Catechol 1,2-dioxygenase/hydroxyquinol 1,2-dioxygenase n=1 Tax=Geodermatophilus sabuli TaxID=1564158 RepID=A0A285E5U6_9ACTN|nr:dioxygenase [Geodermatophilus sabuli]MBB3082892.1 protocatechuate 3,4-dioxygenase beta subunit [Geodermatophilus sabuli]SNX94243.1 catechol 1,2-dioxygenase/hydroxyquinol 1,2-dioxygenase [Geodermatophilus sabuli]
MTTHQDPTAVDPEDITEETVTDATVESFAEAPDQRLRELLQAVVRGLHGAIREVEPTIAEWEAAIDFLTRTGQKCDDVRQEFVLLSDVLGVSALVENINHRKVAGATEATVLGPFHMTVSPQRENGDSIDEVGGREVCVVSGRVLSTEGTPLAGAVVDVWQADEDGFYDVQRPDVQPPGNGRGLFTTDDEGRFWFRTVVPAPYPIPTDGPVGELLAATSRHAFRPAHIHFIAQAPGHTPVTTHIFVAGSPYLDSDAVFAVKRSLVRDFAPVDDPEQAARHGVANPFRHAVIDLIVQPEGAPHP